MDKESVADYTIRKIVEQGVEYLFTVSGGAAVPISLAASRNRGIKPILCSTEWGADFIGIGYALGRRGLSAVLVTSGPGTSNALTPMLAAHYDHVPVLLLSAQTPDGMVGRGAAQEASGFGLNSVELYRPYTKFSAAVPSARAIHLVDHAIRLAQTPVTGPAYLGIAGDVARQPIAGSQRPNCGTALRAFRPVDRAALDRVVQCVRPARRVVILAGFGAYWSGAEPVLKRLMLDHGIDVVTTPRAKGIVPEILPRASGVWGQFPTPSAVEVVVDREVEVLIVVGSVLNEASSNGWHPALASAGTFVHIDMDPTVLGRNYDGILIQGDPKASLEYVADCLDRLPRTRYAPPVSFSDPLPTPAVAAARGGKGLAPKEIVEATNKGMPDNALMFCDIGEAAMCNLLPGFRTRGQNFFTSLPFGPMGIAIAAIGGALAAPDRPAYALLGDGAFLMTGMELRTAVDYEIPLDVVILDNGGHLMVKHGVEELEGKSGCVAAVFRQRPDLAAIAAGLGATAIEIETEREFALALGDRPRSTGVRALIVKTDPDAVAPSLSYRNVALRQYFAHARDTGPVTTEPMEA